jgi:hypothetical protein
MATKDFTTSIFIFGGIGTLAPDRVGNHGVSVEF